MIEAVSEHSSLIALASVGALGGVGLVTWLIKRDIKKVINHVDDSKSHVDPESGYVRPDHCKLMHSHLEDEIVQMRAATEKVHGRIDAAIQNGIRDTETVLVAIRGEKNR